MTKVAQVMERATDGVALGAATSPFWMHALEATSSVATLLLPIAGLTWLLVQIVIHIRNNRFKVEIQADRIDDDEV